MNLASKQQNSEVQLVTTSEDSSSADARQQCRFCLSEDMEEDFVEPCRCSGSARFVHRNCLTRWQRLNRDTECQICRESWRFKLDPLDRLIWLRSVSTNPRYRRDAIPENTPPEVLLRVRSCFRPGGLILQTPAQADETNARALALTSAREALRGRANLMAAVIRARVTQHWHKAVFIILHSERVGGTDGSDALVAANVARLATEAPDDPTVIRLREAGVERCHVIVGGPCRSGDPLCIMLLEPRDGSAPPPSLTHGDIIDLGSALDGENGSGQRLLLAEPDVAVRALRKWLEVGWRSDALILNGVAIWSSDQLLTEMVRGSWGVTAGRWGDVPVGGISDEPDAVWSTIWEQRAPDKLGE